MKLAVLVLGLLISLALGQLTNIAQPVTTPIGISGNGTIWYQSDTTYPNYVFGNVKNPLSVSIIYEIGSVNFDASICFNYLESVYPIDGVNLASSCPAGGLGTASNTSSENLPAYKEIRNIHLSSKSKFISSRLAMATPTDSTSDGYSTQTSAGQIYVKPGSSGGFIVTIPDSVNLQRFNVFITGQQCADDLYPVGSGSSCEDIPDLLSSGSFTPTAGMYYYYKLQADSVNSITVAWDNDDVQLYIQRDYYPTIDWYLNGALFENSKDDSQSLTILSPSDGEQYFFAFYTDEDDAGTVNFNYTTTGTCAPPTVGYNCRHDTSNGTDPYYSVMPLSATLVKGTTGNNGSALSFNLIGDDDDDTYNYDYAYFYLTDYPDYPTPYYIRVTVANNDVDDENGAPPFFAKRGAVPSAQSNVYNMSTIGDVSHQILVKISAEDLQESLTGTISQANTWYFAVQLPVDFSIWVGANCAGNCSSGKHGDCYCGNVTCESITNNGTSNFSALYVRPSFLSDSAGACTCSDDDYENSYDCTQRSNGNSVLYIVLIAVGGAIVLAVAIGVPLYCFFSNRKTTYDRVM